MRRSIAFLSAAAVVVLAPTARADFVLTGTEHLNVNASHDTGVLWDSSTANVLAAGKIYNLYANDTSSVHVSGGEVSDWLKAYDTSSVHVSGGKVHGWLHACDTSSVDISGGNIYNLYAYDTSSVNMSGGIISYRLNAYGTSSVHVSGGSILSFGLDAYDTSTVDISGGSINGLYAYDTGSVNVSGASINTLYAARTSSVHVSGGSVGSLSARDTSSVDISGGTISGNLIAGGSSSVALHGYDFRATGGLTLAGDEVLGTGVLTGKWFNGRSWAVTIDENASTATIQAAMLAPSVASFADAPTLVHDIDFGTVKPGDSVPGEPFAIWNLAEAKWSMNLDLVSIVGSGDTGLLTADLSPFTELAAGQSNSFTAWIDTSVPGDFAASYVLNLSDRLGTDQTLTLNLRASVVPEPSTLMLLATGALALTVGWSRRRRRVA